MKRYRCSCTNKIYTSEEIKEIYKNESYFMKKYHTFEDYMKRLLDLGRHGAGGVVEV